MIGRRGKPEPKAVEKTHRGKRLEQRVNALLRAAYIGLEALPYPDRLLAQRFNLYAQNEEDGLVLALLKEAGIRTRSFVDIGCGDNGGNSGFLAIELGFRGLMIDADERKVTASRRRFDDERIAVEEAFVTRENVNQLIASHGLSGEIDFLSIDIDGNDVWVLDALDAVSPRVLAVEYNSLFGAERAVTIPYQPRFSRKDVAPVDEVGARYYGASLRGVAVVARRKGYRLVVVEPRGTNAFLLRDDVATHVPELDPAEGFRLLNKHAEFIEERFDIYAVADRHQLELVELEG